MKKCLLSFAFFLGFFFGHSQLIVDEVHEENGIVMENYKKKASQLLNNTSVEELNYSESYEKLSKLYIKKQQSESSKKADSMRTSFIDKMQMNQIEFSEFSEKNITLLEWVTDNIETTSFLNIDQAKKEYEDLTIEDSKQYVENEEFYVFLFFSIQKFGSNIFRDVIYNYEINSSNSTVNKFLLNQK